MGHLVLGHMEHPGGGDGVEVLPGQERLLHGLVPGDVGQQPQLDLGIVRIHQHMARGRHEHLPHFAAQVRAGGDVLQIGLRGAQAARGRYRHLEAGADAAVGVDDLQKPVGIGAFQLGILPVGQHVGHQRLILQLLQHVRIGGPAGFRLFPVGQAQVLEQHLSQLLGGIDVELLSGGGVNALLQLADGVGQVRTEPGQGPAVHQKAAALHIRQHPAQGQLHIEVQLFHALLPEPGQKHTIQGLYRCAIAVQRRPGGSPVSQRGEGVRLQMGGLFQLLVEIRHKQPLQVIAPCRGIQQIRRQGRIEHEALRREAAVQQRPHQILHVVRNFPDVPGKQRPQQGVPVPLIAPGPQLRRLCRALAGIPMDRDGRQVCCGVQGHVIGPAPLLQQSPGLLLRFHGDHRGGVLGLLCRLLVGPQVIFVNELLKFQPQEQVVKLRPEGPAQVLRRLEGQGRIGDDGGQPIAVPGGLLPFRQLADHVGPGVDIRQAAVQLLQVAVLLHQGHGGFLPHPRHTGNVVRRVPHQGLQVDHMNGIEAVLLPEGLRGHVLCGGLAHAGGYQLHPGPVRDQLQAVLVAGDDDAVPPRRLAFAADGADEVVGLVARQLIAGHGHGRQHLLHHRQLHGQLRRHGLALGLVVRVRLVAEGWLPAVKGDAQGLRLLLVQQPLEGGDKAVYRMGIQALPGGQRANAVIGAVQYAVAVDNHQLHGDDLLCVFILLYLFFLFGTRSGKQKRNVVK